MRPHSQSSLSKGVFQVAYAVHDIQAAQRFFNETLGGPRRASIISGFRWRTSTVPRST